MALACSLAQLTPRIELVVLADDDVGGVAGGLGAAVDGEVLGGGDDAVVARVVALHAGDEGYAHTGGEVRIFAVSLLTAAPVRITEDVDVGRPEVEDFKDVAVAGADGLHMFDATFGADHHAHVVDAGRIEGGGEADGLGELGGALTATP